MGMLVVAPQPSGVAPGRTSIAVLSRDPITSAQADVGVLHRAWRPSSGAPFALRAHARRAVFVRAQDAAAQATLQAAGVHAAVGSWALANVDDRALAHLLQGPGGLQLRTAPAHRPLSTESLQDIDAVAVQDGTGLPFPMRGKGVLVGIVDTGLDLSHPAFRRADGTSRVVAYWDQDAEVGPAPAAYGYGQECNAQVIAAGTCTLGDPVGHGTHVAGIAAGNAPANGAASEADLAVVSSSDFTRLADAVGYLMALADTRDQPLVINVSVGGQYGPHDGRTPLEIYLDDMARAGRIVVAAAGNDGASSVHVGTTLSTSSAPVRMQLEGLPVGTDTQTFVEFWTTAGAQVDAAVEVWINGSAAAVLALPAAPNETVHGSLSLENALLADISFAHEAPNDHGLVRHAFVFDRSQASYLPEGGKFVIRLAGQGDVQGWISQSDYNSGDSHFGAGAGDGWLSGDGERSIAVPATALKVIAVGSYTVRTTWSSESEGTQILSDVQVGKLSPFSSQGPTGFPDLTGFKPDLCAPGSVIVSARAASVPDSAETVSNQLMVMQGTSMASPHVAGVVALMLQANPRLDPRQVRDLLRQSSRTDAATGSTPNYAWGYGKLDALSAVQLAGKGNGCAATPGSAWAVLLVLAVALKARRRTAC